MSCFKKKSVILNVLFVLVLTQVVEAIDNYTIEISAAKRNIEIGEPLIVELNLVFEQPQISALTSKPVTIIKPEGWSLQTRYINEDKPSLFPYVLPPRLNLKDKEGLKYEAKIEVFGHLSMKENVGHLLKDKDALAHKIIFEKAGNYTINFLRKRTQQNSNSLSISVKPSTLGEKALSLLTDPVDFAFLTYGETFKSPKTLSHLEEVVKQCDGHILAQKSSARLGLEYFNEFRKNNRSMTKFKEKVKQGVADKTLFNKASRYMTAGLRLPDNFPIREEILQNLFATEVLNSNYIKANVHLDELFENYPNGKYSKEKASIKKDLQELQERELEQKDDQQ